MPISPTTTSTEPAGPEPAGPELTPRKLVLPTTITAAELDSYELPEPVFILPGIIPTGLAGIAGRPKRGKSWFVLGLALNVAVGGSYLGRQLHKGDVLYFATEDSHRRLQRRARQIMGPADIPANLTYALEAPKLGSGFVELVQGWADKTANPRLVVVDTLASITPQAKRGQDLYTFTTDTLRPLQHLAHDKDLTVLLVHHTRKPARDRDEGDPFDDVLGSTAITGVLDTTLVIKRPSHSQRGTLSITGRDVDEATLDMEFDKTTGLWLSAAPDPYAGLTQRERKIYEVLEAGTTQLKAIATASGVDYSGAQNVLGDLIDKERVVRTGWGTYAIHPAIAEAAASDDNDDNRDNTEEEDMQDVVKALFGEDA